MAFIIAIDGPAASGKGTIGRALAADLGFHHLDTGLLYRATGVKGGDPVAAARGPGACAVPAPLDPRVRPLGGSVSGDFRNACPRARRLLIHNKLLFFN